MLSQDETLFITAQNEMQIAWGTIDVQSDVMPFAHTTYYDKDMGAPLLRKLVSFADLIDPGNLPAIKHQSNALEAALADSPPGRALNVPRPINLDPGYIEPSKLVLATTKNYAHRVYIGDSMYAESTLHYHKGRWQPWPFTYPDYAGGAYDDFLNQARTRLLEQQPSKNPDT